MIGEIQSSRTHGPPDGGRIPLLSLPYKHGPPAEGADIDESSMLMPFQRASALALAYIVGRWSRSLITMFLYSASMRSLHRPHHLRDVFLEIQTGGRAFNDAIR
jgi:hypothetical protein